MNQSNYQYSKSALWWTIVFIISALLACIILYILTIFVYVYIADTVI